MAKKNYPTTKVDPVFLNKFIEDIKIKRQDKFPEEKLKPVSSQRITLAVTRLPYVKQIKQDIINAKLK